MYPTELTNNSTPFLTTHPQSAECTLELSTSQIPKLPISHPQRPSTVIVPAPQHVTSSSHTALHIPGILINSRPKPTATPYQRQGIRDGIAYGNAMKHELAAYVLDPTIVPRTFGLITVMITQKPDPSTGELTTATEYLMGSLQEHITHHGSVEDFGPSLICVESLQRVGILDIRCLNNDRHSDNMLAIKHHHLPKGVYDDDDGFDEEPPSAAFLARFPPQKQQRILQDHWDDVNRHKAYQRERGVKLHQQSERIKPFSAYFHSVCSSGRGSNGNNGEHHYRTNNSDENDQNYAKNEVLPPFQQNTCEKQITAVPIDHALAFPSIDKVTEVRFEWLSNPAAMQPFSPETLRFIAGIDILQDAFKLFQLDIRSDSILSTIIASFVLKYCALDLGMNLFEIGSLFVVQHVSPDDESDEDCDGGIITRKLPPQPVIIGPVFQKMTAKCFGQTALILSALNIMNENTVQTRQIEEDGPQQQEYAEIALSYDEYSTVWFKVYLFCLLLQLEAYPASLWDIDDVEHHDHL